MESIIGETLRIGFVHVVGFANAVVVHPYTFDRINLNPIWWVEVQAVLLGYLWVRPSLQHTHYMHNTLNIIQQGIRQGQEMCHLMRYMYMHETFFNFGLLLLSDINLERWSPV